MTKNLFSVPTAQTFWGKHGARRGHITGNATDQDTLYAPTVGRLAVFVNYGEISINSWKRVPMWFQHRKQAIKHE